jgi:hypothetical protein
MLRFEAASMTITYLDSALAIKSSPAFAHLQTILIEPLLIVAAVAFWFVALPFVAVSAVCVKIWDTVVGSGSGNAVRTNSLILRRSAPPNTPDRVAAQTAQI